MTAGIDIFVHNLVNAAGGKADHEILQRLGRGLRKAKDKTLLRYYDFLFRINKYLDEHSDDRVKMLQAANHEVVVKDEIDFPI
jgi:superfamily II DNA or RNA helicase